MHAHAHANSSNRIHYRSPCFREHIGNRVKGSGRIPTSQAPLHLDGSIIRRQWSRGGIEKHKCHSKCVRGPYQHIVDMGRADLEVKQGLSARTPENENHKAHISSLHITKAPEVLSTGMARR